MDRAAVRLGRCRLTGGRCRATWGLPSHRSMKSFVAGLGEAPHVVGTARASMDQRGTGQVCRICPEIDMANGCGNSEEKDHARRCYR